MACRWPLDIVQMANLATYIYKSRISDYFRSSSDHSKCYFSSYFLNKRLNLHGKTEYSLSCLGSSVTSFMLQNRENRDLNTMSHKLIDLGLVFFEEFIVIVFLILTFAVGSCSRQSNICKTICSLIGAFSVSYFKGLGIIIK